MKAFVYKNAQQIKSVPELIRDLESRPLLCNMIGFPFGKIPDESNFYRFLHEHKNSKFQEHLYSSNKILLEADVSSTDIVIADKANTKENNPKNPNRSLDKTDRIRRNPKATLGYYSYLKQPVGDKKKKFSFFWGFLSHVLLSQKGIPLVEITHPNNARDGKIAKALLRKLKDVYGQKKGRIFLGDSGYDERELYTFIKKAMKDEPYIALNPRNQQLPKSMGLHDCPLSDAGLEMKFAGLCSEKLRSQKHFDVPSVMLRAKRKNIFRWHARSIMNTSVSARGSDAQNTSMSPTMLGLKSRAKAKNTRKPTSYGPASNAISPAWTNAMPNRPLISIIFSFAIR